MPCILCQKVTCVRAMAARYCTMSRSCTRLLNVPSNSDMSTTGTAETDSARARPILVSAFSLPASTPSTCPMVVSVMSISFRMAPSSFSSSLPSSSPPPCPMVFWVMKSTPMRCASYVLISHLALLKHLPRVRPPSPPGKLMLVLVKAPIPILLASPMLASTLRHTQGLFSPILSSKKAWMAASSSATSSLSPVAYQPTSCSLAFTFW
mmetsp:Transcript_5361/g.12402  ORF Transcript_5361/g.12402 Transcript_5361/m.12402 type:complete len:208 (-) Transcript_5361:326-949(-)